MPTRRPSDLIDRLLAEYEATGTIPGISGGDHEEQQEQQSSEQQEQKPDPKDLAEKLKSDPGLQEFVNGLIAAERKRTEDKLKAEADAKAQAEREAREREEAKKLGDFEKVEADLTQKVQTVEQERDSLKATLEKYEDLVRKDVEAQWGEIPEEVRETYTGEDDDLLAKKDHIQRNQKIIDRLTQTTEPRRGNGPNPRPGTPGAEEPASPMTRRQILT